jgi:hypothetical protein
MRGSISKKMAEKMKMRESIKSELRGNQPTPKIDHEEKKKKWW